MTCSPERPVLRRGRCRVAFFEYNIPLDREVALVAIPRAVCKAESRKIREIVTFTKMHKKFICTNDNHNASGFSQYISPYE